MEPGIFVSVLSFVSEREYSVCGILSCFQLKTEIIVKLSNSKSNEQRISNLSLNYHHTE